MKNIVIVGGSFSGVGTAHRILKWAAKSSHVEPFKVTLVSRDSHFYWNLASPRAIVEGQLDDDTMFRPIAEAFAKYPAGKFEFVLGSAIGMDTDAKTLEVKTAQGVTKDIAYDYLVLGTGAHTKSDSPFKSRGSTEATRADLHQLQDKITKAKTIVIGGGGLTGVEAAGEIASEYGRSKKIILLSQGSTVLTGRPSSTSKTAEKQIRGLGIDLRLKSKVIHHNILPTGSAQLTLEGGKTIAADLYIPTSGVVPNSSFVPPKMLNERGFVKVGQHLDVKGADGVFAIGEVSDTEMAQYFFIEKQAGYMAKHIIKLLSGSSMAPYKPSNMSIGGTLIGKKAGTGNIGSIKMPTFMAIQMRKNLFVEKFAGILDGSAF